MADINLTEIISLSLFSLFSGIAFTYLVLWERSRYTDTKEVEETYLSRVPESLREKMEFYEKSVGPYQYIPAFLDTNNEYAFNNLSTTLPIVVRVKIDTYRPRSLKLYFKQLHADFVVDFGKEIILGFYPNKNMIFNGNIQKLVGAVATLTGKIDFQYRSPFVDINTFNVSDKECVAEYLLWCSNRLHKKRDVDTLVSQGIDMPITSISQSKSYTKKMWEELLELY